MRRKTRDVVAVAGPTLDVVGPMMIGEQEEEQEEERERDGI